MAKKEQEMKFELPEEAKSLSADTIALMLKGMMAEVRAEVRAEMEKEDKKGKKKDTINLPDRLMRLQESEKKRAMQPAEIELFQDNDKYKDDVYIGVNGKSVIVQRGKRVQTTQAVKDVIDHMKEQTISGAKHLKGLQDSFETKKSNLE